MLNSFIQTGKHFLQLMLSLSLNLRILDNRVRNNEQEELDSKSQLYKTRKEHKSKSNQ